MPMWHLHHSDYREAFREVQVRQLRALKLAGVATPLPLPYGRVPAEFTCPRCDALPTWVHRPT